MPRLLTVLTCLALPLTGCVPELVSPADDGAPWEAPTNGWGVTPPPEGLAAEGFEEGQVVPEFRLPDQNGETVSLWQFYGQVVVLDVSTMWCAPCRQLAETAQEMADEFKDQGFFYTTVFPEDADGDADDPVVPDQEDLLAWGEYYEILEPLISDGEGYSSLVIGESYPVVVVIDREMRSLGRMEGPSDEQIREKVLEGL